MRTQLSGDKADAQLARRAWLHREASGRSRGPLARSSPLRVPQRVLFPSARQSQFFFRPKVAGKRRQVQKTTVSGVVAGACAEGLPIMGDCLLYFVLIEQQTGENCVEIGTRRIECETAAKLVGCLTELPDPLISVCQR